MTRLTAVCSVFTQNFICNVSFDPQNDPMNKAHMEHSTLASRGKTRYVI